MRLDRCNLRSIVLDPDKGPQDGESKAPTPLYTHSILEDMFIREHLQDLHKAFTAYPALTEAATLLKLWATNRKLAYSPGSPNGFALTMLLVHLLRNGKLSKHADGFQLFRSAIEIFSSDKFLNSPLVVTR